MATCLDGGEKKSQLRHLPTVLLAIAFAGLFSAGVLSAGHVLDLPVPCGGSRGCGAVAAHPASKFLGVPIAYVGMASYLAMIGLLATATSWRWGRLAILSLAFVGTVASVALLIYARTVIQATCPWCVASGVAMTGLLLLAVPLVAFPRTVAPPSRLVFWLFALVTAGALGAQAGKMQKDANAAPVSAELLRGLTESERGELVDPGKSLGPADAGVTIVIFADLHCPACMAAHGPLLEFQAGHPEGVRLVFRHLPLWNHSTISAVLSEVAAERGRFWEFARQIHARHGRISLEQYRAILESLELDPDDVQRRVANDDDPAIARVNRDIALADRLGIHSTPNFLVLMPGQPPRAFNLKTLPRILNSPEVTTSLQRSASIHRQSPVDRQ